MNPDISTRESLEKVLFNSGLSEHEQQAALKQYFLSVAANAPAAPRPAAPRFEPTTYPSGLEAILDRKRDQNDFDKVLIHDLSRLTRSGAQHAMYLLKRFDDAGITVQVAGDPYPISVDTFAAAAAVLKSRRNNNDSTRKGRTT
jgi:Resolvase, N terminal domain